MKKLLLFIFILTISSLAYGQDFSLTENFDSYKDGDKIAQVQNKIRTWSNSASADAPVSSEQAHSGSNSLKLFSTAQSGGPSDIIVPFSDAGKYTEGNLTVEFWMYVAAQNEAYFNFQGDDVEGNIWATQFFSDKEGKYTIEDSKRNVKASGQIPMGEWFKMTWDINLTSNFWRVSVNDSMVAIFGNITNAVSMADFYPTAQTAPFNSLYYIDDIAVEYNKTTADLANNAAVYNFNLGLYNLLEGGSTTANATFKNVGNTPITSLEAKWTLGGTEMTQTYDGINIAPGDSLDVEAPAAVVASTANNTVSVEIIKVNGAADADVSDNKKSTQLTIIIPAADKKVLVEEATGTWCGWCPRGAVFIDSMSRLYPEYFIGVAVHGGNPSEPMKNDEHLNVIRPYVDGFPKIVTMRASGNDPLEVQTLFTAQIQVAPTTKVKVKKANFDASSRTMEVTVEAEFLQAVKRGTFKLGAILVEDSVTGNTAAYNQANYYSGGSRGKMGGYENLPNPVPYSQMVYNHVSRSVFGAASGVSAKKRRAEVGDVIEQTFTLEDVPEDWDESQFKVVGFATVKTSKIDNADEVEAEIISATNTPSPLANRIQIAPNPFITQTNITLAIEGTKEVQIRLEDLTGKTLASRDYGKMSGKNVFPIVYPNLAKGVYLVHIMVGEAHFTKKLVKQ